MNNNERRFKYYDMSEEGFKNNEQLRSEPIIKIFDDPAYTIEEYYADCSGVQLERMKDYGRGWYCYTTENENGEAVKRYVNVYEIEKHDRKGRWEYDADRKDEFGMAPYGGDFECHLQNTAEDRELFEIMVYDWKCDHEEDERDEEEGELVFRLGPPDQIYELGKEKYLTYIKVAPGYGNMGGYAPNFCKLTFVLYKEKVDNWHYEGNLCDQYIESINLQ